MFEPNGLFSGKVEVVLLPNEHGAAGRFDYVVIAFGVDDLGVPQGLDPMLLGQGVLVDIINKNNILK